MLSGRKYELIYAVVMDIPVGRVATYGQTADLAGLPRRARMVGFALKQLPAGSVVPWHRVVNSRGEISERRRPDSQFEQQVLLEDEGIRFNRHHRISLAKYQWQPSGRG
ncbi:MAG: MGMT family protein [bacterium]